jgi:hypothetical protein
MLLVLIAFSLRRKRQLRTAENQAIARAHTGEPEAQQELSRQRRAGVREAYAAAHEEPAQTTASDADAQGVGSDADE